MSGRLYDDHGNPARWAVCDGCGLPSLCLLRYTEASGPCMLDPDYADLLATDRQGDRQAIPGGAWLRGEGGPLCGNCVAEMQFCADTEACKTTGWVTDPGLPPPPQPVQKAPSQPPWAQPEGGAR
jgi:hypothetical protein